uniref:ERVV2 protein n=1 Tax=Leptobrachium leishanense TaxID=445787 RepID=A0A8C5QIV0_9ANUR
VFGFMLPTMGVARLYLKLNEFSEFIDEAFNHSTHAMKALTEEQRQIRDAVIHNRLALDYLLTKEGGVCGLLNLSHCCFHIDDKSGEITQELQDLEEVSWAWKGSQWSFGPTNDSCGKTPS